MIRWLIYALRLVLWTLLWPLRKIRKAPHYLVVEVRPEMPDLPPRRGLIARLLRPQKHPSVYELVERLPRLAEKEELRGLIVILRPGTFGAAKAETLHQALAAFRETGRQVHVWTKSLDLQRLVVASAGTHITLASGGSIGPLGMHRTMHFFGDTLSTVGVGLDVIGSGPHKSAYDSFTRSGPSEQALEMMNWLFDDIYANAVALIAKGRQVTEAAVNTWVDEGLLTDARALETGVVDAVANETALFAGLAKSSQEGKPPKVAPWSASASLVAGPPPRPGRAGVGIIRVSGAIVDGPSKSSPLGIPMGGMSQRVGDETVIAQCRQLAASRRVKAVVLYIDSPGGSAAASEAMADALSALAERKPLVAVMGSMAASGGYYVATTAKHVVARRTTLTGSIGVIMAKVINRGLLAKLHVGSHDVARGARSAMFSPHAPFTDEERQLLKTHMARTYALFTERVAAARGIAPDALETFAQGRVWTGQQALDRGLVDAIGGLDDGLKAARTLANLPADAPVLFAKGANYTPPSMKAAVSKDAAGLERATTAISSYLDAMRWLSQPQTMALSPIQVTEPPSP